MKETLPQTEENTLAPKPKIRDNSKRSKNLINAFWLLIVISAFAALSSYWELQLLEKIDLGNDYTDEEVTYNDSRQFIVGLLQTGLGIATMVFFIMWFRRGYYNASQLKMKKTSYDDSWALWGFIVPIISLFYPYNIAREINENHYYYLKRNKEGFSQTLNNSPIGFWWAAYLITNVIGRYTFKTIFKDETLSELITSAEAYIISDLADVIAALITVYMIMKVSEKEQEVYNYINNKEDHFLISK